MSASAALSNSKSLEFVNCGARKNSHFSLRESLNALAFKLDNDIKIKRALMHLLEIARNGVQRYEAGKTSIVYFL